MKPGTAFLTVSTLFLVGSVGIRFAWPATSADSDPGIRTLEERHRSLAGFADAISGMEANAVRVRATLWPPGGIDAFVAALPQGWIARPISSDTKAGITLHRYAFSKEAAVGDFPEFQRVLKKLEERASTRIDTVNLTVNGDGRRFATALITATLPVSPNP